MLWHQVQAWCPGAPCLTQVLLQMRLLGWDSLSTAFWVQYLSMIYWNTCVLKIQLVSPHDPNIYWWDRCRITAVDTCSDRGKVGGTRQPILKCSWAPAVSSSGRVYPYHLEVIFHGTWLWPVGSWFYTLSSFLVYNQQPEFGIFPQPAFLPYKFGSLSAFFHLVLSLFFPTWHNSFKNVLGFIWINL